MSKHDSCDPSEITLADVLAFHRFLIHLEQAGLPLALEPLPSSTTLESRLARLAESIAVESATFPSLKAFFLKNGEVPVDYAESILEWHSEGKKARSIRKLLENGKGIASQENRIGLAMLEPIALAAAGLLVIGLLLTVMVPWMERIYLQSKEQQDWSLKYLGMIGPNYGILVVLIFLGMSILVWRGRSVLSRLVVRGVARSFGELSKLDDSAKTSPLDSWMKLRGHQKSDDQDFVDRVRRLATSDRRMQVARIVPSLASIFLGGVIVLAVGLCLFYPMAQLLLRIARV
jgi:hypothetical protein